jgi:hypothetical protein
MLVLRQDEIESIGGFLSHLASLAAHYVSSAEPLAHIFGAHQLLSKLFLCEDDCKFFLSTYGAVAQVGFRNAVLLTNEVLATLRRSVWWLYLPQKTTEALEVNGHHAIVPPSGASKYFVAVFNKFCDEHGFEHILRRLSQFLDDMVCHCQSCTKSGVLFESCSTRRRIRRRSHGGISHCMSTSCMKRDLCWRSALCSQPGSRFTH